MNVPKLRFKEFNDEWKKEKFGQFTYYSGKRNKNNLNLVPFAITNTNGFVPQIEAHNEFGYMKNTDRKAYNIVTPCSFAYNPARINVGSIGYYSGNNDIIVSSLYEVFKTKDYINDNFLWYWLKSNKLPIWINKLQEGSVRLYFYYDKLCETPLYFPKINEQKRIANLLELLDKKIELQSKKIEDLKLFKKGLIEKEISGKDYNDINLSKILKERKMYSEKGLEYPHVTLSKDGIYDKGERYNRDFLVKSNDKNYKITKLNDLCYNPANLKFGVICLNEYGPAIFSPIYVTFEISNTVNPKYIKYYVMRNNFINAVRKYEQGTVYERMSVSPEDFLKFNIKIPNLEKQDEIVFKISKFEEKINLEESKLIKLNELKKGLMQSMFV